MRENGKQFIGKIVKYIVYLVLIIVLFYLQGNRSSSEMNGIGLSRFYLELILRMTIGLVIGLDYFMNQMKQSGKWRVNFGKLLLLALPMLIFSIFNWGYVGAMAIDGKTPSDFFTMIVSSGVANQHTYVYAYLSQLMLGYFLITSFYKKKD